MNPRLPGLRTLIILPIFLSYLCAQEPAAANASDDRIYLTWQRDPLTTMTIVNLKQVPALPPVVKPAVPGVTAALPNLGEVELDGTAAEWWEDGLALQFLPDLEGRLPDPSDLQAEFRMGWNEEGLVIAVKVKDDQAREADQTADLWKGDSIEVFVAEKVGSSRRYQVLVAAGTDPLHGEPRHFLIQQTSKEEPQAEALSLQLARSLNAEGYTLEMRLPWSNLPSVNPTLGTKLALQLHVVDVDGNRRIPYTWYPADDASANPLSMEWVRLDARASEPITAQAVMLEEGSTPVVRLQGGPDFAGRNIQVRSGNRVLAAGVMEAVNAAMTEVRIPLPSAPAGKSWGEVEVWMGDRLFSTLQAPQVYPDAEALTQTLRYWETGADEDTAKSVIMKGHAVRFWQGKHLLQTELTGLKPDTAYRFQLEGHADDYGFRTLPADLSSPLRLAFGGDVRHRQSWMDQMNRVMMNYHPRAVIWGGDLAYANGEETNTYRWQEWFDSVHTTLRDADNVFVPLILGIGNHEVRKGYSSNHPDYEQTDTWREKIAPYYYQLVPFPGQPGYGVLDVGEYLSLVLLDTGHSNPMEGAQTAWLEQTLEQRSDMRYIIPVYHVPAWPSVRGFDGRVSEEVRSRWLPLFERGGVRIAFENHDHVYKRTVPIRNGQQDESGIVYVGDGSWGVEARTAHDLKETWYLQRAENVRHGILMELHEDRMELQAFSSDGKLLDEFTVRRSPPNEPNR